MRRSLLITALASAWLAACWGGERTRPRNPTPAKAPFSPALAIPRPARERPPPPLAPSRAQEGRPEDQPPPDEETAPDRDPPAGQLGTGDEGAPGEPRPSRNP